MDVAFYIGYRPDLIPNEGPSKTREEARRFEKTTASRLRHRGYKVSGGHVEAFMSPEGFVL